MLKCILALLPNVVRSHGGDQKLKQALQRYKIVEEYLLPVVGKDNIVVNSQAPL